MSVTSPGGVSDTVNTSVSDTVDRAARSRTFERAARAGYTTSGVLHLLIALLVVRIATGGGGNADQSGALAAIAGTTYGTVLLWAATVGLGALALWRLAEAAGSAVGRADGETLDRLKAVALAVVYLALAVSAARFAMGSGRSTGAQNSGVSAELMAHGAGRVALVVVGLVVLGVGGYHVHKGVTKGFFDDLQVSGGTAVTALGMAGYTAKGLVLGGAGVLVVVATLTSDPAKAAGIDAAVKTLGSAPFGQALLFAAAVGLAAYGLFCFVQARHARM